MDQGRRATTLNKLIGHHTDDCRFIMVRVVVGNAGIYLFIKDFSV